MTTLNQIRSHSPCTLGWAKLLKHLGKTSADDEPLSLLTILDSNGLDDAIWCLRTEATPERTQRFTLAVARRAEHHHPQANATLDIFERYLNGTATKAELDAAVDAAVDAAARAASRAASRAAADTAFRAAFRATFRATSRAAADTASRVAAYAADREAQVQIFKEIFA